MSVVLNILSEFDGSGIDKAKKQFSQLETSGQKAQFLLKKAAIPATAALAGLGAVLFDAAKGAMEDEQAQAILAQTLRNTTGATDAQIKANEDWISAQGRLIGITDDELRPVLGRLTSQTHDVQKAQELARLAMDVSAGTGKNLTTVTEALAKAAGGNTAALAKLSPELKAMAKEGASADEMMAALSGTFMDQAEIAGNTTAGGMKKLSTAIGEAKEGIGAALLPILEKLMPVLQSFAQWAQDNPTILMVVVGAFGALAAAIVLVNLAMAANPVVLITAGIIALGIAIFAAYKKFQPFHDIVDAVFGGIKFWINEVTIPSFKLLLTVAKTIFNGIATIWNNTFGKLSFNIPSWVPGIGGKGFDVPNIPMMAAGGIVTSPTLAMIGEAGPEAVIPLSKMGGGMGGGSVTIHVNGGDPNAVVDALRRYMQVNGSVPIRTAY
ncbi:hypothetical protein UFOVP884_9 [uncultured Caudovirales phage]|uniref:Uncharacterized protein n=1 Tax=uncultured Caudovirales phage TaxID=2100421 RepID=A0A6J5RKY6_9CAUD|nr:hypothetical protein UFOVP293_9 [uncultured Caudovirales phage]CAB4168607.1 hypothetical protein UFOVP884_9 [uncultured Caudovirales phage]CAB4194946.1 hypothetical protein UFOVP1275_11 [uncultured Caudovirales phage]CAB4204698.1 hypothetical protein UFOVP1401_19 [uncultured Caudovirales phage]